MRWAWLTLLLLLLARVAWPVALREISPRLAVESLSQHHRFTLNQIPMMDPPDPGYRVFNEDPWGNPFIYRWKSKVAYSAGPNGVDEQGLGDDVYLPPRGRSFYPPPQNLPAVSLAYAPEGLQLCAGCLLWCMGCWWLGRGQRRTVLFLPLVPATAMWFAFAPFWSFVRAHHLIEPPGVSLEAAPLTLVLTVSVLLGALGWARSQHPRHVELDDPSGACA